MHRAPDACGSPPSPPRMRARMWRHAAAPTHASLQVVENVVTALHAVLPHLPKQWGGVKVRGVACLVECRPPRTMPDEGRLAGFASAREHCETPDRRNSIAAPRSIPAGRLHEDRRVCGPASVPSKSRV